MLTNKESRFCEEYMIDSNACQAAIRAGYSVNSAKEIGCQNLTKLHIKEEIARNRAELRAEVGYTVAQAQKEYEQARTLAMSERQPAAAVSAVTGKARLFGMDKDAGGGEKTVIIISPKPPKQVESSVIEPESEVEDEV